MRLKHLGRRARLWLWQWADDMRRGRQGYVSRHGLGSATRRALARTGRQSAPFRRRADRRMPEPEWRTYPGRVA